MNPCSYFHSRSPTVSFAGESSGRSFHITDASTGRPGCATPVSARAATPSTWSGFAHLPSLVSAPTPSARPPVPRDSVSLPLLATFIRTMRNRSGLLPKSPVAIPIRASRTVTSNSPRSTGLPAGLDGCFGVSLKPPVPHSSATTTASTPSTHKGTTQRRP